MTTIATAPTVPHPAPRGRGADPRRHRPEGALRCIAGYVGYRTVAIGLRTGLLRQLADCPGATADDLADARGHRPVLRRGLVPGGATAPASWTDGTG